MLGPFTQTTFGKENTDLGRVRHFYFGIQDLVTLLTTEGPVTALGLPRDCLVTAYQVNYAKHTVKVWIYSRDFEQLSPKYYLLPELSKKLRVKANAFVLLTNYITSLYYSYPEHRLN